ncbi:MAG: hypothetical protein CSB48_07095 [Proteobacteria bacterium]|nr:MAG: hypothetical protein CSB48_07095 [Pseudomonadota bacterium]PIE40145.1 MAG: hypothetical protein CSA51_01905 [Gammaproteobacteria bacterium]
MKSRYLSVVFFTGFLLLSGITRAADIAVSPGNGTLAQAVADASSGDTLVLDYGSYVGNGDLVIDKSLTIRSMNAQTLTAIIVGGAVTIDGTDIDVTLQGLGFSSLNVNVVAAADVKLLENKFVSGADANVTEYKTTDNDGRLTIVGNHFSVGSLITTINSEDAYIAGNTFDRGHIVSNASVWIVGNSIRGTNNTDVIHIDTVGFARVLANRVYMPGSVNDNRYDGIDIKAGAALVAGNIVQVNHNSSTYVRRGIYVHSAAAARVVNNVVDAGSITHYVYGGQSYGILAYGEVSGNMVINLQGRFKGIAGSSVEGVKNNLCFANTHNSCGSAAITVDPKLIDRINYQLASDSPAIDAGSTNPLLADLDRSRNDIGAHGGSWDISQYDAQRDPLYLGPFVYPLFEANSGFVDGKLQVRALGVARLR